jgi:hypothetical protein
MAKKVIKEFKYIPLKVLEETDEGETNYYLRIGLEEVGCYDREDAMDRFDKIMAVYNH